MEYPNILKEQSQKYKKILYRTIKNRYINWKEAAAKAEGALEMPDIAA